MRFCARLARTLTNLPLALAVFALAPWNASAQEVQGLENLFGGIVGAAIEQQNRVEWQRIGRQERSCIAKGLHKDGVDFGQIVSEGVPPTDPRVAQTRRTCQSIFGRKLQQNIDYSINTSSGVFTSKCDEDFANAGDNKIRVSQQDAIDQAFSDQGITTGVFERTDAQNRRQQMMSSGSTGGPIVNPNFDCSKARSDTEIAICNSAVLSGLDAEYGSLYRRYHPAGRLNPLSKEATVLFKERNECGSADDCIKRNLEKSVEVVARVLRRHGDNVETSIEHAEKLAAQEQARQDEQKRAEQREIQVAQKRIAAAQRQADNDRRVEAERIEADRKAAEERARVEAERAARLDREVLATNDIIKTASDFLKYDKSNPRLLTIAEAIAEATSSLDSKDPDKIAAAKQKVDNAVKDDPKFSAFQQAAADAQSKENARLLSDALTQVRKQKRFLESYIGENPTSAAAKSAISYVKSSDEVLASTDLKKLRGYIASVQDLLRQYDLQENFLLSLNAVDDARGDPVASTEAGLGRTAKNRFLMDGAPDDLVLMYISAPGAPDVVRNLRGDIVFDNSKAIACIYQASGAAALRDRISTALARYSIKNLLIQSQPCTKDGLLLNDVIAVLRGEFLKQELSYAAALTKEIESDHVKPLLSVRGDETATALQSIAEKRKQIEADIGHDALDGFGLAVLPAVPAQPVCGSLSEDVDAHQALLGRFADPNVTRLRQRLDLQEPSFEDVFKQVQRSKCSAVYASASDLKLLLEALRRDQVDYFVFQETVTKGQVKEERGKIDDGLKADEKANLDRQKAAEEARALQDLRERDLASSKAVQQAALRAKYGKIAASTAADITNDVKAYFESGGVSKEDVPGSDVSRNFPHVADWYESALRDHWELQSVDGALDDYGSVDWKGRPLVAAFSIIRVRLKNAVIGEYRDGCFKVGHVIDHEFNVTRDPVDFSCDDATVRDSWATSHSFRSVWNLN